MRDVTQAIGQTPLVDLSRLVGDLDGRILGKLEYLNPGHSKKDRMALEIIEEAEKSGELAPGMPVVELTSGNAGTGLAIVCAVRGYPFVAVMSRGNTPERARMMRALGAEVVLVDQVPGSVPGQVSGADLDQVEIEAQRITRDRGAFRADQFNHPGNPTAHLLHTGEEIWTQSGGEVDAFCDFVGSAGSFAGCARSLKGHRHDIRCYVVEPDGAPFISGSRVRDPGHRIQGGGYNMKLSHLDRELVDGFLTVTDDEAVEAARALARKEGIFAGFSSGANCAAALQLVQTTERGRTVVVLINDSGMKYMSTDLWD